MLHLQRASAGSGKTYTLAKKYILYLISYVDEGGKRRLRRKRQLRESAGHILAITFTNKATSEMKERIVMRLSDLSNYKPGDKMPDYLEEFSKELGVSCEEVSECCGYALEELLNNFSDFRVSTIDSFFQTILRTFAYETDLNDAYQVEIDSEYAAKVGVDAMLSQVNSAHPDPMLTRWLKMYLDETLRQGNKWNLFHKREGNGQQYATQISNARRLESEQYKKVSDELDKYFDEHDFFENLRKCRRHFEEKEKRVHAPLIKAAQKAKAMIEAFPETKDYISGMNYLSGRFEKACNGEKFSYEKSLDLDTYFKKNAEKKLDGRTVDTINDALREFYSCVDCYFKYQQTPQVEVWKLYTQTVSHLGLLQYIRAYTRDFFRENNIVQLGETNMLLSRIIGEDDAPFIYERVGSYLNHYLIDEFQDTSDLQWGNLCPLLAESDSNGHENLIIGDVKQSIYRFRNANPQLIMNDVPNAFPNRSEHGNSAAENKNYRSWKNVVRFNNFIFEGLAAYVNQYTKIRIVDYYSNVSQDINKKDTEGYVSLRYPPEEDMKSNYKKDPTSFPVSFGRIGEIIDDARTRGYSMDRIGILVVTNDEGKEVVNALMDYNRRVHPDETQESANGLSSIKFISEESLLISNSRAVKTIVAALEMIELGSQENNDCKGKTSSESSDDEERNVWKKRQSASKIGCSFNFFASQHPELSGDALLREFFENNDTDTRLSSLIQGTQSTALPALVESIILNFVDEGMRKTDAAFIAAFLDLVAEHCERYAADVATFLRWWRQRGVKRSLSSPEGSDAVNIMTIHKSKGLEFDVVIIPALGVDLGKIMDSGIQWVKPRPEFLGLPEGVVFPAYIPLTMSEKLLNTPHEQEYMEHRDAELLDNLNKVYVAFTRAVRELYVFMSAKKDSGAGGIIDELLSTGGGGLSGLVKDEDGYVLGRKVTAEELGREQEVKEKKNDDKQKMVEGRKIGYFSTCNPPEMKFKIERNVVQGDDEEENPDPRAEGNLLHMIMESVDTSDDMDRELESAVRNGVISEKEAERFGEKLRREMACSPVKEWFDASAGYRILNERSLMVGGGAMPRPDRMLLRSDGSAIIIDYKFGEKEDKKYERQVQRYCRYLRNTGLVTDVEGWLWYVTLGKTQRVE